MFKNIFIVDDDEISRNFLMTVVQNEVPMDVWDFRDPEQVIEAVHNGQIPDLVITDYCMPQMNGITLLNELVGMLPSLCGIVVTGNPGDVNENDHGFPVLEKAKPDFMNTLTTCMKTCFIEHYLKVFEAGLRELRDDSEDVKRQQRKESFKT